MSHSTETTAPAARLRRNVPILGLGSLLNDTASEMAYWVLPFFLTTLGAGPELLGLIEGCAESTASLFKLLSGSLTDRSGRRKPLVLIGYILANTVKPLLGFTHVWGQVLGLRVLDRSGKGLRGAPRDVIISESVPAAELGAAYGLRQAMDSVGAIIGPALAFWIMLHSGRNVRLVFWLAAIPGALAIATVVFGVTETGRGKTTPHAARAVPTAPVSFGWGFYLLLAAVGLFGIANFSDMFLILRAQSMGVRPALIPLLGLVFNVVFAGLSFPLGRLSDRVRRKAIVGGGLLIFAAVHCGFALARRAEMAWLLFALYGLYQATTQGALSALTVDLVGKENRGRAFGWVSSFTGISALLASVLAGWLWKQQGPVAPFILAATLATIAAILIFLLPVPHKPAVAHEH